VKRGKLHYMLLSFGKAAIAAGLIIGVVKCAEYADPSPLGKRITEQIKIYEENHKCKCD